MLIITLTPRAGKVIRISLSPSSWKLYLRSQVRVSVRQWSVSRIVRCEAVPRIYWRDQQRNGECPNQTRQGFTTLLTLLSGFQVSRFSLLDVDCKQMVTPRSGVFRLSGEWWGDGCLWSHLSIIRGVYTVVTPETGEAKAGAQLFVRKWISISEQCCAGGQQWEGSVVKLALTSYSGN